MFELLEEELEGQRFNSRETYESWVNGWVEDMIDEASRAGRWALQLDDEFLEEEMEVKIRKEEK